MASRVVSRVGRRPRRLIGYRGGGRCSGRQRTLRFERLEPRQLLDAAGPGAAVDPLVSIPDDLQAVPGQMFVAPVNIDEADGLRAAEIHIQYDTTLFHADNGGVRPGSVWPETNTSLFSNVDDAAGTIEVWVFGVEPLGPGAGSLIEVEFAVATDAPVDQCSPLDLTEVELNEGEIPVTLSDGRVCIQPGISIDDPTVTEGDGGTSSLVFTVTLSTASSQRVTVQYRTVDETATAPSDYTAVTGEVIFEPGETSKSIEITVLGDTSVEPDENFTVELFGATGALIVKGEGTGTILNDDEPSPPANGRISGFVYADTNHNHRPDACEGVPGVLITLSGEGVAEQTWTDAYGWYEFRGLAEGTYTVVERQPECMIDGGGNVRTGVVVSEDGQTAGQDFRELGLKAQYVFNRFYATTSMPVCSEAWRELFRTVVQQGEEDAGHVPSAPPVATQQIPQQGPKVLAQGSNGDDNLAFTATGSEGGEHEIALVGESRSFGTAAVTAASPEGSLGIDPAGMAGPAVAHQLGTEVKPAPSRGPEYVVEAISTEEMSTAAGIAVTPDKAVLVDAIAGERLQAEIDSAWLAAFYYEQVRSDFEEIAASSGHGGQEKKDVANAIAYVLSSERGWTER